ncbi:helix-turn-helix domain-containing protein [Pendulispora albinea]|uniref:AraC family transcriptional regulator n=1 Tax=Pendulispora albinea TaxID=2741071 RepID=A0ABZ2MAP5_9BACT
MRPMFVGRDLLVAEWHCDGQKRPWSREVPTYDELDLPRAGVHLRARGRHRQVVDATTAAFTTAEDGYARASPTARPQTSTLIFLRGELASAQMPGRATHACRIAPEVAKLHFRLLGARDPVAIEETALALVARILTPKDASERAARELTVSPSRRRLAHELQHVMATRFAEHLTLESIAAACKTSPFHASRVFRLVTGETIHGHLTRVRLRIALFELRRGAGRLTDIALSSGFSSHSHFTSAFRAEFGCPPSAFVPRAR